MNLVRNLATVVLLGALMLTGCGDGGEPDTAGEAYRQFFQEMNAGNRNDALEALAPEGDLGDTFRGGAYFTLADNVEALIERHGELAEVTIESEEEIAEDTTRVEGVLRFADGTEVPRGITFMRENGRWVAQI